MCRLADVTVVDTKADWIKAELTKLSAASKITERFYSN